MTGMRIGGSEQDREKDRDEDAGSLSPISPGSL
jgi:hypothetical protein